MKKISVLFVCMGNICRSPMAEGVFKDLVAKKGLSQHFNIASAATGNWHIHQPPHAGTQAELAKHNIQLPGKRAQRLTQADLENYDYILLMDEENIDEVRRQFGVDLPRLLDYVPNSNVKDVPDPYYNGRFAEVFHLVTLGSQALLDAILQQHPLE